MKTLLKTAATLALIASPFVALAEPTSGPTPAAEIKWMPLVPQLGDKGPQVSVVFGDMKKKGAPIGVLITLPAGFSPGPHIHSSPYTGVVIAGEIKDTDVGGLEAGTYMTVGQRWYESANRPHDNICSPKGPCELYAYFPKGIDTKPVPTKQAKK